MKDKRKILKRIMIWMLCFFMFMGNAAGVAAAEPENPTVFVYVHATVTDAVAVFDKEEYLPGDMVNITLTPNEGYILKTEDIKVSTEAGELEFVAEEVNGAIQMSFQLTEQNVELTAAARKTHKITFSYKDMNGNETGSLFETGVLPEVLTVGTEVNVSVNYKGTIGWAAVVSGVSSKIAYEMSADHLSFLMPDEDVHIELEEMEVYNKGDLSTEDTQLGEDVGKEHQVSTNKEYEPDVSLGKSAKWDDIEKGTATLTLTQKAVSDWSDNPSDYMIVLDRTISMVVDHTAVYDVYADALNFGCSVCLNPNHFYMYKGKPAKLIDYGHGFYISSGEYFSTDSYMGSDEAIWEAHYDSTGKRIAPRVYNDCTDRLTIAQNSIKDILNVLEKQNQTNLAGGKKNRVMYWSFSGSNAVNDGTWDELPVFTEDMKAVKKAIKYEAYPGTYYYRSFVQMKEKLLEKQKDVQNKDIPTKVIFISDGMLYDKEPERISKLADEIKKMPNTKLYTILIGNSKDSEAGKLLKSYATSPSHFATVTSNWDVFVKSITAIQKDQFEIKATQKVVTDKINTEYWEVVGEPILEAGNGTASLDADKKSLTWKLPEDSERTYTCKIKLKLKDQYRYKLSDTNYATNEDEPGATNEDILKNPQKAGATIRYKISGGKYNGEERTVGVKSPELKYGTVKFEGTKHWTVEGSSADAVEIILKRTMPGTQNAVEINNTTTNVSKNWNYVFDVRQMPDGKTYPLIKYNNAGERVTYEVGEILPQFYTEIDKKQTESEGTLVTDLYNEPFKVKAQISKIDEETKNPLSGAEFSVYAWSEKFKTYVPYRGTHNAVSGDMVVKLKEGHKGVYTTPVWLYYSADNQGKFRIIETNAPKGYFGDWKDPAVTSSDLDKQMYDFVISKDISQNAKTIIVSNTEEEKFANQRVKGKIIFTKLDKEGKVPQAQGEASLKEAVYKLYAAEDILHQDGTTGVLFHKDQEITVRATANLKGVNVYTYDPKGSSIMQTAGALTIQINNLELGKYYVKEETASEGYLVDPQKYKFDVAYVDEKTQEVSVQGNVYEKVKKQSLTFYKYTSDDNSDVLEPMTGAGFSVYLVKELENGRYVEMTDEELVQAVIDDLRNPTTLLYDTYEKYQPAAVFADSDSEDVKSERLLKNVVYDEKNSYQVSGENEYLVAELKADEKGHVKVPALPYGRYIIIETTTPEGKTATRPFIMNVTCDEKDGVTEGDKKGTPLQDKQLMVLVDRSIMSLVKIVKRDAFSKNPVLKEGASYIIHDVEGAWLDYITNEMTTAQKKEYEKKYKGLVVQYSQGTDYGTRENPFITKLIREADENQNVYIETPMPLPSGTYELEELQAPEGYILQGHEGVIAKNSKAEGNGTFYEAEKNGKWKATPQSKVRFVVSNNESVYDETIRSFVTTVKQDNEPAIGKISIFAEGERLTGVKKGNASKDYEFQYELRPVQGAVFEIRAAEDIFSQEGGVNGEKLYEKGALVVTLTTDKNGQTWTGQEDWEGTDIAKGLPLGKYEIIQKEAGEGFFLSDENKEPREVEISYEGQEIPVIYRSPFYINPRQNLKIEVEKTDAVTGKQLEGAVFGLYTKTDLKNDKNKTIVKADTLIATAKTEKVNGKISCAQFASDLPLADYYVKELEAPAGYLAGDEIFVTDVADEEVQKDGILKFHYEMKNQPTKVTIRKVDLYTEQDIEGAKLCIIEKNSGQKIAEWKTEGKEKVFNGLKLSDTEDMIYILKEVTPSSGYVTAEDIFFKLVAEKNEEGVMTGEVSVYIRDGKNWKKCPENVIVMKDDITKVEIQKRDSRTKELLAGAELELRDSEGKVLALWTSSEKEGFTMERIPIGTYRVVEKEQMEGYKAANPLVIKVTDSAKKQMFIFENTPEEKKTEEKAPEKTQSNEPKNPPTVVQQQTQAVSTGDYAPIVWCILALVVSGTGIVIARKRRK